MRKTAILVIILCGFAVAGAGKQKPKGQLVGSAQSAAMTSATGSHGAAAQAMSPEQVQALKDDLARMRVLVQQM